MPRSPLRPQAAPVLSAIGLSAIALSLGVMTFATPAMAGGFYLQEQAPKETGRALSGGAAAADDPSIIYFNPAGMTNLPGVQLTSGGVLLSAKTRQSNAGSTRTVPGQAGTVPVTGTTGGNPFASLIPVPSFYASAQVSDRLWAGLGVNAPFGLKLHYDDGFFGRYDSLYSDLKTYNIQPSAAYKLTDSLSVGGGVDVQYVKVTLTSALPNASPAQADGLVRVKGDDWSFGWNAGIFYQSGGTHVGAHYRSRMTHRLHGSYTVSGLLAPLPSAANRSVPTVAPLVLPDIATISISHAVTPQVRIMASANWYNWSIFKNITIIPQGGNPSVKELNYKDSYSVSLGGEYDVSPKLTLRGGAMFDATPTNKAFLTTRVPDGDRTWLTMGATYALSDHLALNLSYAHNFIKKAQLNRADTFYAGTAAAITTTTRATTSGNVDQFATSLTARF